MITIESCDKIELLRNVDNMWEFYNMWDFGFVVCVVQNSPNILFALVLYSARLAQEAISSDGLLTLLRPPDMYPMTKPGCDCLPRLRCSGSYVGSQVFGKFGSGQKYRSTVSC